MLLVTQMVLLLLLYYLNNYLILFNGRFIENLHFATLAEYKRTKTGLITARIIVRKSGRKYKITPTTLYLAEGVLETAKKSLEYLNNKRVT